MSYSIPSSRACTSAIRAKPGEAQRYFNEAVLTYEGDECLHWPFGRTGQGYGSIGVNGRMRYVHALVCEYAHGCAPTPKHEAAHSCGNGHLGCVAKAHLSWKTHAENMADMRIHGTLPKGERHGFAKLTEADIRLIRSLEGAGSKKKIGEAFGIGEGQVGRIHRRQNWGWVE